MVRHQYSLIHFTAHVGPSALFDKDPMRLLKTYSTGVISRIERMEGLVKLDFLYHEPLIAK